MSLKDKAKATAKNIEGKLQETVGNITGYPQYQAEGKAKQAEAKVRHTVEDIRGIYRRICGFISRARRSADSWCWPYICWRVLRPRRSQRPSLAGSLGL